MVVWVIWERFVSHFCATFMAFKAFEIKHFSGQFRSSDMRHRKKNLPYLFIPPFPTDVWLWKKWWPYPQASGQD